MEKIPDTFPPEFLYVGKLRYAYRMSVSDVEAVLHEVGGKYNSLSFNIHRGEDYSREKTCDFLDSLTSDDIHFGRLIEGPGSLVDEARALSHDGNYNTLKRRDYTPREIVRWGIIDTCMISLYEAVPYIEGILGVHLVNELSELTHELADTILKTQSLNGSVPAYYCIQYNKRIVGFGADTPIGRRLRAYLYAAQGVMDNKDIVKAVGYSQANITKYINEGRELARKHGLPSLDSYFPPKRTTQHKPKPKKHSVSG